MRILILLLASCFFIHAKSNAQTNIAVTGQLKDTVESLYLEHTSVSLIHAEDSLLAGFTRSDLDGNFKLSVPKEGEYIIIVSHPSFATYIDKVKIENNGSSLGEIILISKKNLLEEVIISGQRAIMIKGDTIEYAADSFKVREFANVDELLKKLPGLEVNKDGSITAHGEKVQKMFVDGEEFFSDDPAVLAKTLKASSISKVQVFDDKSENAKNTGIDDGEKVKTINLTLKEDAKKGTMGRVGGGYAVNNYYEGEALLQNFKGKQKLAVFALGGNTHNNQLGWQDRMSMSGGSMNINEDGNYTVEDGEFGEFFDGDRGLPKAINGGAHYSNKFFDDAWKLNANYNLSNRILDVTENGTITNNVPGEQYITKSQSERHSENLSNSVALRNEIKIDTFTSFNIAVRGGMTNNKSESSTYTSATDASGESINNSQRNNSNESDGQNGSLNLTFKKRFAKEGRSMSISTSGQWNSNKGNGYLTSNNYIKFNNSNLAFNQSKQNESQSTNYRLGATYSEPLIKNTFLELNYAYSQNVNLSDNKTFDIINNQEVYNNIFSNHYKFSTFNHRGGAAIRFAEKKIKASLGLDLSNTDFKQENYTNASLSRNYSNFNLFPRATFNYKINTYSGLNFRYNGSTKQPSINQIQPIRVNTDPTNILIGNENLNQEFNHSINLNYNTYSVLKGQYTYVGLNSTIRQNPISQSQTIDQSGFKVYQYVNTKAAQNYSLWAGFNQKIIENLKLNLNANGSYNRNYNFINGLENLNNSLSLSPSIGLDYDADTLLHIQYRFRPQYNTSSTSIRTDIKNEYWAYNHYFDFNYTLPKGFTVGTDVNWNIRPKLSDNIDGMNVFLWNAYISKTLLKDRSLLAKIYCYDILNQNSGYSYYQAGDLINEQSFSVIKQYFMFSLTWNFNSMKGNTKDAQQP